MKFLKFWWKRDLKQLVLTLGFVGIVIGALAFNYAIWFPTIYRAAGEDMLATMFVTAFLAVLSVVGYIAVFVYFYKLWKAYKRDY